MASPAWLSRIFFHPNLNVYFRSIIKALSPLLPKKLKLAPAGVISIKVPSGKRLKLKTNQTNYGTKVIYWKGYESFEYTPLFLKLIPTVDVFFDVGANIGYYSLLAATEKPSMNIVAFEPATGPLHYLKENVKLNQISNVTIESLALSNKKGRVTFYEQKNEKYPYLKHNLSGRNNAGISTDSTLFTPREVSTMTLDEYVSEHNIETIDLIKLDTEGTEHMILKHAETVLKEFKPIVICETLFDSNEDELEQIFLSHGYELYKIIDQKAVKVETIKRISDDGVTDCIFIHPEAVHRAEIEQIILNR